MSAVANQRSMRIRVTDVKKTVYETIILKGSIIRIVVILSSSIMHRWPINKGRYIV